MGPRQFSARLAAQVVTDFDNLWAKKRFYFQPRPKKPIFLAGRFVENGSENFLLEILTSYANSLVSQSQHPNFFPV